MAADGIPFFGKNVPFPPDGKIYKGESRTKRQWRVLTGKTSQFYQTSGYGFYPGNSAPQRDGDYITFVSQKNFSNDWCCASGPGNLTFSLDLEAPVMVCAGIIYFEVADGSHEITAAQITVTDAAGNLIPKTGTLWELNTDQSNSALALSPWGLNIAQPNWALAQSPQFMLPAGPCTVTFLVDVASDNAFYIRKFGLVVPDSAPKDIAIDVYWQCFYAATVYPGANPTISQTYTSTVETAQSTTSIVATELGMSLGATLEDISLGLTASIKNQHSSTDTVTLQSTASTTYTEDYPNNGKTKILVMLWNPMIVYKVGKGTIVQGSSQTLLATTCSY